MNKRAANVQTLTRLDEIEAQLTAVTEAQNLTIDDVRQTIHQIAEQIAAVADAIPAIAARLEEMARWVADVTKPTDPSGPPESQVPHVSGGQAAAKKAAVKK
jgi:methyl-accepting chemotaxis protein